MSISDLNNDDYDRGWMDGRDSAERESEMKEYYVNITISNCFWVTAEDEEHAENIVREMNDRKLLKHSEFSVNSVDEAPSI
jgi:hypothetical protein